MITIISISRPRRKPLESLQISVAKLYIFLLPFRMIAPLAFLNNTFPGAVGYFDLILHFIGLMLILMQNKGVISVQYDPASRLFHYFCLMITWFNISSIIMSIIIQSIYGNYAGETAFSGIIGMMVYFTQYALMFLYNKNIFRLISKEEILLILEKLCIFLLCLGYLQIFVLNFGGTLQTIIEKIDIFQVLLPKTNMPKLSLTGSEGASAGSLISIFVLPLLYSRILTTDRKGKYVFQILLWIPVIFFTRSSTAYIITTICTIIFLYLCFRKATRSPNTIIILILFCVLFLFINIAPDILLSVLPENIRGQIQYLLFEKVTDFSNGSTVSRIVPIVTNRGAFSEYPVLGVGNGLQGYFYIEYFPDWAYNVRGSDVMIFYKIATNTIVNGALFFPSLLSGYGIVGIILIVAYIIKSERLIKSGKDQLGAFYYLYRIAAFSILFAGFQGDFCGTYYIWFILSIPYMVYHETETSNRPKRHHFIER